MPKSFTFFEMGDLSIRGKQLKAVTELLTNSLNQGREVEVRYQPPEKSVYVLVSPADDLGHVYKVGPKGGVKDIGVTEKQLGE